MANDPVADLKRELKGLMKQLVLAGVPSALITSIDRKCLRTPRRQTGRLDRRTNREPRWRVAADHPDFGTELDAHLIRLSLFIGLIRMANAPKIDESDVNDMSVKYFGHPISREVTTDPVSDEPLDYLELVSDVVTAPRHGYSRFHIGHQDPRTQPKHLPANVRWQFKASNDFQGTMDVRVARIAYRIDEYTRTGNTALLDEAGDALEQLRRGGAHVLGTP